MGNGINNLTSMNFIAALIDHVPELRSVYSEHIEDYDEVLPHVFMGDVTRFIAQQLQTNISDTLAVVRRILDVLERGMISGDDSVQEIISVSFGAPRISLAAGLASCC